MLDKMQGLSKEILIVSCVKHNKKSQSKDIRKLYISFNHAQKKLIIVGSMNNLKDVEPLNQFIAFVKKKNWYLDINNAL